MERLTLHILLDEDLDDEKPDEILDALEEAIAPYLARFERWTFSGMTGGFFGTTNLIRNNQIDFTMLSVCRADTAAKKYATIEKRSSREMRDSVSNAEIEYIQTQIDDIGVPDAFIDLEGKWHDRNGVPEKTWNTVYRLYLHTTPDNAWVASVDCVAVAQEPA